MSEKEHCAISDGDSRQRGDSQPVRIRFKLNIPLLFENGKQETLKSVRLSKFLPSTSLCQITATNSSVLPPSTTQVQQKSQTLAVCETNRMFISQTTRYRIRSCSYDKETRRLRSPQRRPTSTTRVREPKRIQATHSIKISEPEKQSPSPPKAQRPPGCKPKVNRAIKGIFRRLHEAQHAKHKTRSFLNPERSDVVNDPNKSVSSSNDTDDDNEEHQVWDNSEVLLRGINLNEDIDENGQKFGVCNLYKARYGLYPGKREKIENARVVQLMSMLAATSFQNKPSKYNQWSSFNDHRDYSREYIPKQRLGDFLELWQANKERSKRTIPSLRNNQMKKSRLVRALPLTSRELTLTSVQNSQVSHLNPTAFEARSRIKSIGCKPYSVAVSSSRKKPTWFGNENSQIIPGVALPVTNANSTENH